MSKLRTFIDKHDKLLKITASCLNAFLVLILFLSSAFLLFFIKTPTQTVFGYNSVLVHDDLRENSVFILLDKASSAPKAGDEFLYIKDSALSVFTVDTIKDDTITFLGGQELSLTDKKYGGKVLWESGFIGNLLNKAK